MSVFIITILVLAFVSLQFAASEEGDYPVEAGVGYTVFDVGELSVAVPEGWMVIPVMDMFGKVPNTPKTNSIKLCKGAVSPFDIMIKPSIEIIFYGSTKGIMPPKSFYKDVVELDSFMTGDHVWGGFSASALMGKRLVLLWEDTGVFQYQVNIWAEGEDSSVSLHDADVMKILESITPKTVI